MIVIAAIIIASGRVLALGVVIPGNNSDSLQCNSHLASYREFFKEGKFDDALPHWRWAFLNYTQAGCDLFPDNSGIPGGMISLAGENNIPDQLIDLYGRLLH